MSPGNTAILGTHIQCKKKEERGKTQWEENPPSKYNEKVEKRQLLGSRVLHLQTILQESKLLLSEILGEDVSNLLGTRTVLKIDDPILVVQNEEQSKHARYLLDLVLFLQTSS